MAGLRDYRVFVRAPDLTLLGQIDTASSLELALTHQAGATWSLQMPAGAAQGALLAPGRGIVVYGPDSDDPILSGPLRAPTRAVDSGGRLLTLAGIDDTARLAFRAAYPDPTSVFEDQSSVASWTAGGQAETVIKALVLANAGPGALVDRRIFGLNIATDEGRGAVNIGAALRYDQLLTAISSLAGELGFRIIQDGGTLVFDVYEPRDLTATARFSAELGNLESYGYTLLSASTTAALILGQGEGTARTSLEVLGDVDDYAERVETVVDRRDTDDDTVLLQAAIDTLATGATQASLTIGPVDTVGLRYGRDYSLGDLVTVDVDGVAIQDVVRQVKLTITADGVDAAPVIGGPDATDEASSPRIVSIVQQLAARVRALEARQ